MDKDGKDLQAVKKKVNLTFIIGTSSMKQASGHRKERAQDHVGCFVTMVCSTDVDMVELALLHRRELSPNRVGTIWLTAQEDLHG